jgi:hypothetical protein
MKLTNALTLESFVGINKENPSLKIRRSITQRKTSHINKADIFKSLEICLLSYLHYYLVLFCVQVNSKVFCHFNIATDITSPVASILLSLLVRNNFDKILCRFLPKPPQYFPMKILWFTLLYLQYAKPVSGALANLQKAATSWVMSVPLSVRMEQLGFH